MKFFSVVKNNHGSAIVILMFAMVALLGFSALVVDIGLVMAKNAKLQSAIDASSLAAAQELPNVTSARAVANNYIALNGFVPADITIAFSNSNRTIDITSSKDVNFFFAKVLGLTKMTIHPRSSATKQSMGGCFDYVLFSGSKTTTLTLNGSDQFVDGNSHTNKNFTANGSKINITGACEAMTTVKTNGSQITIGSRVPNAPFVAMPDFTEIIRLQAQAAGTAYTGNKTYNGSFMNVDSSIYVNGKVTVNGSHFRGQGCVLATGDITFNGSNLNETTSDAVCFYSANGDITINGSSATFEGILYAPNGTITMNGSSQTIHGRVIGNSVTINGSSLVIAGSSGELESLPSKGVKLVR